MVYEWIDKFQWTFFHSWAAKNSNIVHLTDLSTKNILFTEYGKKFQGEKILKVKATMLKNNVKIYTLTV